MKKIVLNISLGLAVFHIIMMVIYHFALQGLMNYDHHQYNKFDLLFKDNSKQDIVVLGSSRTYYGVNSFLLEKLSGKKVVNAGLEGAKLNEMELTLKGYLFAHPKPEKVILMLDPHSFGFNGESIYNKIYIAHYFSNDSLYEKFYDNVGYKTLLWKWLPYSLISEFDDYTRLKCIKGLFTENKQDLHAFNYKGFSLLKRKFAATESAFDVSEIDMTKGEIPLYNILNLCVTNNIDVQVVQGPFLKSYFDENKIAMFYDKIETFIREKFPNVKVQTQPLNYENPDCFKDQTHLNDIGSTKYTLDLFITFIKNK